MSARFALRVRAVCCREWGCTPWEFDVATAEGRIAIEDIVETFVLAAYMSVGGSVLLTYLHREREIEKKNKRRLIWSLVRQADLTTDPAKKEELAEKIRLIQHG